MARCKRMLMAHDYAERQRIAAWLQSVCASVTAEELRHEVTHAAVDPRQLRFPGADGADAANG